MLSSSLPFSLSFLSSFQIKSTHHPEQQHDRDGRDERDGRAGDRGLGQVPVEYEKRKAEREKEVRSIGLVEREIFFFVCSRSCRFPERSLSRIQINHADTKPFLRRDLAVKVHRLELLEDSTTHFFSFFALFFSMVRKEV